MKFVERFKSWAVWLSLAALVAFIVKSIWHIDIADWLDQFLNYLCPVLVAFGIVNNPTDREHF